MARIGAKQLRGPSTRTRPTAVSRASAFAAPKPTSFLCSPVDSTRGEDVTCDVLAMLFKSCAVPTEWRTEASR